jgi:hypothetical protein
VTKRRSKKTQINKIRNEKVNIKNTSEIHRDIREYFENLYSNKLEDLDDMDKFLDLCDLLKLTQEDISHLNR